MKHIRYFILLLAVATCAACTQERHLISQPEYLKKVEAQFQKRKVLAQHRDSALFTVFSTDLSTRQKEGLMFLYAYMPLSDLADYDGRFFLQQVNYALKAKDEFPWGKTVPEDLFLHFVLPYRVNNENLDTARVIFFHELKERIQGMSAYDAVLEVNHWCHEKVSYRASDGRTSSPLASLKTSFARCGEESTFAVTALRSVGFPARQVYTPRWAHQDDNHAWVEVYVDNQWQYMGACEPEAKLNVGWFDVPAKRAMMVHTKAFGDYNGTEEVNKREECFSELNVLPVYTDTTRIWVKVTDTDNHPISDADIQFKLYNYSEFYPLATRKSNEKGVASLLTGRGDLYIWAAHNGKYNYQIAPAGTRDTLLIRLEREQGDEYVEEYDLTVPKEQKVALLPAELIKANDLRLAKEDSIRNAYMQTFMDPLLAKALADDLGLDDKLVAKFIQLSYGNHGEIEKYLRKNTQHPCVLDLLKVISEKDLRDITASTLTNHLIGTLKKDDMPQEIFNEGILSPRIKNEGIRPWRGELQVDAPKEINGLAEWVRQNIHVDSEANFYGCPLTPIGVHELRVADPVSRDIYFVALCRESGIPARIHPATSIVQIYTDKQWKDFSFEKQDLSNKRTSLTLTNGKENGLKPEYYSHFTLQKFNGSHFVTLDYEEDASMKNFPVQLSLEPGYYLLMTGHRYNDGNVRTRLTFFNLRENEPKTLAVELLPLEERKEVLGTVDMSTPVFCMNGEEQTLKEWSKGKGLVLSVIDPGNEPTRHIMADLPAVKASFDAWGGTVLFLVPHDKITSTFKADSYTKLPDHTLFATDKDRMILKRFLKSCGKSDEILPSTFFITDKGEVIYLAQGYRIGIGENLLKVTKYAN